MSRRNVNLFVVCLLVLGAVVLAESAQVRLPANNRGYEPEQPIAFSHRLHAGELAIDCLYCHFGAESSRHAGVPSATLCMNCHAIVTASFDELFTERELALAEERDERIVISDELRKLYDALALGDDLQPAAGREPTPIEWVRVHNLPDFVYFDHRVHVARDVACETCHGPVQAMERVRQETDLSMGWCVNCHRDNPALPGAAAGAAGGGGKNEHVSIDCAACHY